MAQLCVDTQGIKVGNHSGQGTIYTISDDHLIMSTSNTQYLDDIEGFETAYREPDGSINCDEADIDELMRYSVAVANILVGGTDVINRASAFSLFDQVRSLLDPEAVRETVRTGFIRSTMSQVDLEVSQSNSKWNEVADVQPGASAGDIISRQSFQPAPQASQRYANGVTHNQVGHDGVAENDIEGSEDRSRELNGGDMEQTVANPVRQNEEDAGSLNPDHDGQQSL
jgi:hypothetical protein